MEERASGFEKQAQTAAGERRDEKKALERFRRIQQSVEHAQSTISRADPHGGRLLKKKMASLKAMEKRYQREHESMTEFPEYESAINISFAETAAIPRGKTVLEFTLPELVSEGEEPRVLARDVSLTVRGPKRLHHRQKRRGRRRCCAISDAFAEGRTARVLHAPGHGELLDARRTLCRSCPLRGPEEVTRARTYLGSIKYTAERWRIPSPGSPAPAGQALMMKMGFYRRGRLIRTSPPEFLPLSGSEIRRLIGTSPVAVTPYPRPKIHPRGV
jgi:hypothetical protein